MPGLTAKPVIDIDLTVLDVDDEDSYVPRLEGAGFTLIFRDRLGGDAHRQLTFADLHVWGPGAWSRPTSTSIANWWAVFTEPDGDRLGIYRQAGGS